MWVLIHALRAARVLCCRGRVRCKGKAGGCSYSPESCRERCGEVWRGGNLSTFFLLSVALLVPSLG